VFGVLSAEPFRGPIVSLPRIPNSPEGQSQRQVVHSPLTSFATRGVVLPAVFGQDHSGNAKKLLRIGHEGVLGREGKLAAPDCSPLLCGLGETIEQCREFARLEEYGGFRQIPGWFWKSLSAEREAALRSEIPGRIFGGSGTQSRCIASLVLQGLKVAWASVGYAGAQLASTSTLVTL